jgi:hypothetical protein
VSFITEHDDRVKDAGRQVFLKPGSNHIGKHRNQDLAALTRCHIDDGDLFIKVPGSSGRSMLL